MSHLCLQFHQCAYAHTYVSQLINALCVHILSLKLEMNRVNATPDIVAAIVVMETQGRTLASVVAVALEVASIKIDAHLQGQGRRQYARE